MNDVFEIGFWWIPQIPMKPFEHVVATLADGRLLEEAFAKYDLFQLEHKVKPDYCNAGGTRVRHSTFTDGEWWDVPDDDCELAAMIADAEKAGIDTSPLKQG